MRPFVHEKPHRMPIDRHFDGEVVRCAWFDSVARHRVVVRVYQRLVQIQHQRFALHHAKPVPRHRRQREQIIFDWLVLHELLRERQREIES